MKKVNPNIAQSSTLPADFYFDKSIWEQLKEVVFAKSWQFIGDEPHQVRRGSQMFIQRMHTPWFFSFTSSWEKSKTNLFLSWQKI